MFPPVAQILKTNDPIIVSMGWRRFQVLLAIPCAVCWSFSSDVFILCAQTMPIYGVKDHNMRSRFLKYTPEHMHCLATFYGMSEARSYGNMRLELILIATIVGPLAPPNTGMMAFQYTKATQASFRTSLTGVVVQQSAATKIVKKLKLTGTPLKVHTHSVPSRLPLLPPW